MRIKSRQKQPAKAHDIRLESQTGEAEGFGTLMRRMARDNKLAVLSAIVILLMVLAAVFAPFLSKYDPAYMDLMKRLSAPSAEHLFGTDEAVQVHCSWPVW